MASVMTLTRLDDYIATVLGEAPAETFLALHPLTMPGTSSGAESRTPLLHAYQRCEGTWRGGAAAVCSECVGGKRRPHSGNSADQRMESAGDRCSCSRRHV